VADWLRAATVLRRARLDGDQKSPGMAHSPFHSRRQVNRMANPFQFLQEVRSEAKKVVWPSRRETMITSGLVILMVLASSLFFVVVDWVLRMGVGFMLRIGQ
jgi:preprotein translocase subunit SecE